MGGFAKAGLFDKQTNSILVQKLKCCERYLCTFHVESLAIAFTILLLRPPLKRTECTVRFIDYAVNEVPNIVVGRDKLARWRLRPTEYIPTVFGTYRSRSNLTSNCCHYTLKGKIVSTFRMKTQSQQLKQARKHVSGRILTSQNRIIKMRGTKHHSQLLTNSIVHETQTHTAEKLDSS